MPTKLSKMETDSHFRALFVGPSGRGKTIAATSFPGKKLLIDFDKRYAPIIGWHKDDLDNIDVEVITPKNFFSVFVPLVNKLQEYNQYDTIIIDSVTMMSNTTVVMQMEAKGQGGGKVTKGGVAVPSWDEFNGEAMLLTQMLESLKSLKCNLILTAHPIEKTKIEGSTTIRTTSIISFGTKLGPMIPGYFDEVWFFDYKPNLVPGKPVERKVYTQPSGDYPEAKTALHVPPVIDITGKNLYECIKEFLPSSASK